MFVLPMFSCNALGSACPCLERVANLTTSYRLARAICVPRPSGFRVTAKPEKSKTRASARKCDPLTTAPDAGMVGYSRLIGFEDVGTLQRLRTLRKDLIDPAIQELGGRLVNTGGDSLLVVVRVYRWRGALRALQAQQGVPIHDSDQPPDRVDRYSA